MKRLKFWLISKRNIYWLYCCLLHVLNKCGSSIWLPDCSHVVCRHVTELANHKPGLPQVTNKHPDREGHWTAVWSQCPAVLHSEPAVSWDMHQDSASDWPADLHTGLLLVEAQTLIDITISLSEQEECLLGLFPSFPGEMKTERDWGNPWL